MKTTAEQNGNRISQKVCQQGYERQVKIYIENVSLLWSGGSDKCPDNVKS